MYVGTSSQKYIYKTAECNQYVTKIFLTNIFENIQDIDKFLELYMIPRGQHINTRWQCKAKEDDCILNMCYLLHLFSNSRNLTLLMSVTMEQTV